MMRWSFIGLWLLLVPSVWAAPDWAILPTGTWPVFGGINFWSTTTRCAVVVPAAGVASATKMMWANSEGVSFSNTCSAGIYSADGSLRLATSGGQTCTNVSPNHIIKVTGLTPFDIIANRPYRLCWCASASTGLYISTNTGVGNIPAIQNAFVTNVGTDAVHTCASGVVPTVTGALTPDTTVFPLYVWVSKK